MTKTPWVVMIVLALAIGIVAALNTSGKESHPHQEIARAVLIPTDVEREVVVPPCGTGVLLATQKPDELVKTPGTIHFRLQKGRGDRIVVVPRCRAAQGAAPAEGANLPSSAFILPVGSRITAGRAGSAEAGTEKVQSQLVIPARSPIETIVVPNCVEGRKNAFENASGRAIILNSTRSTPTEALAPPC
jgi:hypothetical protein